MKERTIDILTAVFLIAFSLVMRSQLEGIPREGLSLIHISEPTRP